ncbi:MAG: hypothetical protein KKH83_07255 [Candidatus Margulisbacteria bacterium]|nr:hypothetical protein [Candidatus Margulisiibacteriota bacterium]
MESDNIQIEIFKKMKPFKRLELAFDLHDFARDRIYAETKRNKPQLSEAELNKIVAQRFVR